MSVQALSSSIPDRAWVRLDWIILEADRGARIQLAHALGASRFDSRDLPVQDDLTVRYDFIPLDEAIDINRSLMVTEAEPKKSYRLFLDRALPHLDTKTLNTLWDLLELPAAGMLC